MVMAKNMQIVGKLENLFNLPPKTTGTSLVFFGASNHRKTALVNRFFRAHPFTDGWNSAAVPVLCVNTPPRTDERGFYDAIFETLWLYLPSRDQDSLLQKQEWVSFYFKKLGTKILIVDNIHNVLNCLVSRQQEFIQTLAALSANLQIPIVLIGIKHYGRVLDERQWIETP